MKVHENRCKGEAVMRIKPFYLTPCIVTLTFNLLTLKSTGPILGLMGSVPVKFHEDRCKGEAVMHIKPFYLTPCIVTLTFDLLTLKSTGPIVDSWGVCL